jgi:hypothetical protein
MGLERWGGEMSLYQDEVDELGRMIENAGRLINAAADEQALDMARRFYDTVVTEPPGRKSQTISRMQIELIALIGKVEI